MTFPRPCLYALLAACLLLPGCVANQYAIKINAITNGDIQAASGTSTISWRSRPEDDLVFWNSSGTSKAPCPKRA